MIECRLAEASVLKKIVEALKDLVTDAAFEFSENGLQLQAMDSSHVSLCYLQLLSTGFEHFRCDKESSLGVSLPNLAKVLKCANNDDTLTLKAKDEPDVISLVFESKKQDCIKDFDMKLMDLEQEQLAIPDTEYKSKVTIPADEFRRIIADLQVLGDTCKITAEKAGVRFAVEGDVGKANITLKPGEAADEEGGKSVNIDVEEAVELRFALRYLNYFAKATPLAESVELSMSKDVPLLVEYKMGEIGAIQYYLAPKIDEEDEE
ncbi:Proliferating cell nuclear antigen [Hondaea fermentalgiana]|uniref:DNA sliding clamp PCNA n=1 Tax=Hondaea fermentalgiana TaxID=2315210 RepID=A0A2R5H2M1_9STRA|nr:Proliferating cell nuclear antigen [Hondaea fermentalgiana]|eukprot:GBG34644.1 Proliferating cell nuclear antigen [Hondaea fermentalgiana]